MRRGLALAGLMAVLLATAPASADELGRCGGIAPIDRQCSFVFTYPIPTLVLGIEVASPFAGEVTIELTGPTARQSARCSLLVVAGAFTFSCRFDPPQGTFVPGDQVTMRGGALGAGQWAVFAEASSRGERSGGQGLITALVRSTGNSR